MTNAFKGFPLGHFHPTQLSEIFGPECALIGGLVIAWGQFDRELCGLFSRLLGFSNMKPTDKRAIAIFYSSTNTKARRDAMVSLSKLNDDPLCVEWLNTALDKVNSASDKRNAIIHSEYFADLLDMANSHLMQTAPARKKAEVKRNGVRQQIEEAITSLDEARFFMEFAYAATRGRTDLDQALQLYEPALRERRERQQPPRPSKDAG